MEVFSQDFRIHFESLNFKVCCVLVCDDESQVTYNLTSTLESM